MKLLRLGSDYKDFQSIEFTDGLNIIVGTKIETNKNEETSNGVGKSLSLRCIDFLFGKDRDTEEIKKILKEKGITLNLLFSQNNEQYFVERNDKNIFLNEKEINIKQYQEFLYEINIKNQIPDNINKKILSFRNIFARFFRTSRESYMNPLRQIKQEKSYQNNYMNAFLLKLDLVYLEQKSHLKAKQDKLKETIKQLSAYENNEVINREKELELEEKLKEITTNLASFKIAENYYELEKRLNNLTQSIETLRNQKLIKERQIQNKENIIKVNKQFDIDIDKIENIYKEVKFFFEKSPINHIEAVKNFHNTLFENRKNKAIKDKKILKSEVERLTLDINNMDEERMKLYKDLENKGALEEYQAIMREKENIINELDNIQRTKKVITDLKNKEADLKIEIDKFKKKLVGFEGEIDIKIRQLGQYFREISSIFYKDNKGYLDIKINRNFQTEKLYDIAVKIDTDKSDGISNMKVFIYDMLIYKLNPNLIGFVGHDNILFDSIDERQIAQALKYVNENVGQYICSIHDTKFNEANEFAKSNLDIDLNNFVRLELNENKKLFGFKFGEHLK